MDRPETTLLYVHVQAKGERKKGNEIANLLDVVGGGGGGKTQVKVIYKYAFFSRVFTVGPAIP